MTEACTTTAQSSMVFIGIIVLLDALSLGLIIPVLPMLNDDLTVGGILETVTYDGRCSRNRQ